jgi:hypothetical protein
MADYPAGLPRPLQNGYALQTVSPLLRTEMASGRARQRRLFTSVPTVASCSWFLSRVQAQAFEAWFRNGILDGAEWFDVEIETPLGIYEYNARFTGMYSGPRLVGGKYWEISGDLELRERPVLGPAWGEVGVDMILNQDILDIAMNQEWAE